MAPFRIVPVGNVTISKEREESEEHFSWGEKRLLKARPERRRRDRDQIKQEGQVRVSHFHSLWKRWKKAEEPVPPPPPLEVQSLLLYFHSPS